MKWSEFFSSAITGAREAGIEIEADEPKPIQSVTASASSAPAADTSEIEATAAAQAMALEAAQARIAALEADARSARFTALASDWIGEKATHLAMLAALEGNDTLFAAYITQQKAHAEIARQSGLFAAAGSDRSGASSAWSQIESKARALASAEHITFEQASVRVMDAEPSLYRQYIEESK